MVSLYKKTIPFLTAVAFFAISFIYSPQLVHAAAWESVYQSFGGWPNIQASPYSEDIWGWYNTPLPSYFDAYAVSDPSMAIVGQTMHLGSGSIEYATAVWTWDPDTGPIYTGPSTLVVAPGAGVKLEWACQDQHAQHIPASNGQCDAYDAVGNCIHHAYNPAFDRVYVDYDPAVGVGFTAGTNKGSTVVYPIRATTYKLYCPASGWNACQQSCITKNYYLPRTPTMSITVTMDPCPTPIESSAASTYVLTSGATRKLNAQGYNFCITNSSAYDYFIPSKTSAEIKSFVDKISYLSGITRF